MLGKAAVVAISIAACASVLYVRNATPRPPSIASAEAARPTKPFVIKLHAQWCPVCLLTKGMWSEIAASYSGRVNLVVFDFTNRATTEASRAEARRLGLEQFFDENEGWTGTIAVIDGGTRKTLALIHGSRDFAEYRAAIDVSLRAPAK
jgi:thiol-disulfide isomerase/thioredoxin